MILYGEENDLKKIIIECECGTESLEISKYEWKDGTENYYLQLILYAWDTEQDGFFYKLKNKLKIMWFILTKGQHRFMEIELSKEHIEELRDSLNKL